MNGKDYLKNMMQQHQISKLANSNKQTFPSAVQMAKNLGRDVVKTVQSVAAGNPINASDDEVSKRKSICNSCEFFNSAQDRCTKCGCYMAVKTYLKASHCPINKW